MDLRIPPIERPRGLISRLGYLYMKVVFGKVITVSKVIYSRFPSLMFLAKKIQDAERKMPLTKEMQLLIKAHVATINGCPFCIDIAQRQAIDKKIGMEKFTQLYDLPSATIFNEKERIALEYATVVTREIIVPDTLYEQLKKHWSDEQIIGITYLVAIENYYNRLIKPIGIGSDELCSLATA